MPHRLADMTAWNRSLQGMFFVMGVAAASLFARMPEVRELLGVTNSQLGFLLLSFAIGSGTSLAMSGRAIEKWGTRPLMMFGFIGLAISTVALGAVIQMGSAIGFGVTFLVMGFCGGIADVTSNLDGSALENKMGKTIMPRLHAAYSIGTFSGVGVGTLGTTFGVAIVTQVAALAALTAAVFLTARRWIPAGTGRHEHQADAPKAKQASLFKNRLVLWLAFGILGITIAEGASNDWLVLAMVDDYHVTRTQGAVAYAVLMIAMTATRLFGGKAVDRFGRARTLQVTAGIGVVGLLTVILSGQLWAAYLGSALWGVGVALAFPLFLSAAGEGENAARRVSFVASAGYIAFLAGPPLLGLVGQATGLLNMFYLLVVFIAAAGFFASAAGGRKTLAVEPE